jgi:prepilin-type processing-associated H-X9-DG protein
MSNLKQISLAMMMYAQDYDERLSISWYWPNDDTGYVWADAIYPYMKNLQIFDCPSSSLRSYRNAAVCSYGFNNINRSNLSYGLNLAYWGGVTAGGTPANPPSGLSLAQIPRPAETILMLDSWGGFEAADQFDAPMWWFGNDANYRHNGQVNVGFCDGHVKSLNRGSLTMTHQVGNDPVRYLWTIQED